MASSISIEKLLKVYGPSSASKIKEKLLETGLSENAARQRISRSKGTIKRFKAIKLPRREAFLYLSEQYGSFEFWDSLIKAHADSNSAYGVAIQSIIARGGAIPKNYFNIVSGSPNRLKKHLGSDFILEQLISCKILQFDYDEELGDCVSIDTQGAFGYYSIDSLRDRLLVEDIIIKAALDWARKLNLASYDAIRMRTLHKVPTYGQFGWDITAPSYVYPLSKFDTKKLSPGFITIDVINAEVNSKGVQYFIKKCAVNRSVKNMKPFLAILIAQRFSKEAFKLGKNSGVIFTTPDVLFGKEIAENLRALTTTLENAAATAASDPAKLSILLNSLSSIEGAAINIRGALFELIVGHLVYKGEGSSIDIGVKVHDSKGNTADIDVRRVKGDHQVALYECKGYQPTTQISSEDIETWFKKIPIIRDALMQEKRFTNTSMHFEYWTSGEFSSEATEILNNRRKKTKKYEINWKNGKDILEYARKIRSSAMVDSLKQHYLKHPLS